MRISFTKMQGAGNDFVVLDETRGRLGLSEAHYRFLADRHFGVGADQILTVRPSPGNGIDFEYIIHNADGAEVEQCGNGARCFARFVHDRGLTPKRAAGAWQTWPLLLDGPGATVSVAVLSMGNPHAVQLVDDVALAPVLQQGPLIEHHPCFPNRVNAGFMQVQNRQQIRLRVYERGAGETLACGSGACAAVVAGIRLGLLDDQVDVQTHGGVLTISWTGGSEPVMMTGPATTVFRGDIEIPNDLSNAS